MLSATTRIASKLSRSSYSFASVTGSRRSMTALNDSFSKKEKVEEDRYMRSQEDVWREKLRNLKAQEEESQQVETLRNEVVGPVKADVAQMLTASGDKISDEGLEILAKWKLDL